MHSHATHPDSRDVLEQSVNGTINAMRLELGRYEGKPVDFLEISGAVTADKAVELENLIQNHLAPDGCVDLDRLGRYQSGLVERRSYPLALTQLLITYHTIMAGEAVFT